MSNAPTPVSDELTIGVVSEIYPNQCNVFFDDGTKRLCSYRRTIFDKNAEWRERSPVSPGDKVGVKILGSKDGVIEKVLPRVNSIHRRAPGREGQLLHTLAANLDAVVIVSAYKEPDFSPGFIDRFLIAAQKAEIKPIVVINKMDLRTDETDRPWALYEEFNILCFPVTTKDVSTIEPLREFLKGKTSVFCGHSGVGKTSLLHELFGVSVGKVGAISKATGKGKHTTTVSTLVQTPDGTRFIDTPGIKEFGLVDVDPKELIQYYPELWELQQKHEPYEHLPRYEIYMKIKAALEGEGR
jgi:ribosome biogenesis GTPase